MKEKKLIVLIILFVFSYTSNAQEVWIDSIQYKLIPKGNAAEVINCNIRSEKVIVPSTIYYEGELYNVVTIASRAFRNTRYKSVQLPESITYIGTDAFCGCTFESITIPDNVTTIGEAAFQGCRNLTSIDFGKNLESIGYNAFQDCESLSSVVFPEKLKTISAFAFKSCQSLKVVTIGKSLEYIGAEVFVGTSIEEVHINNLESWCKIQYNDNGNHYLSNPLSGACLYLNGNKVTDLVIPGSIKEISKHAFRGCNDLKSVIIQDGVESIGSGAFVDCKSLSNIILPNSLTVVEGLFSGCDSLKSIAIPEGVKTLDDFYNNPNLTNISLPNSLKNISGFKKCTSLTDVILPANLETIGQYAFEECTSLKSLIIPGYVSNIDEYAFQKCSSLETLTISSGVGKVGYYAFYDCDNLTIVNADAEWYNNMVFYDCDNVTTVYLGSRTKEMYGIFKHCEKIEDVYCYAIEPPYSGDSFQESYMQYITLHVPEASIEKYAQANTWKEFNKIVSVKGVPQNTEIEIDRIKYKIVSDTECEVIYKNDYSGDIVIPGTVSINNKEYKVTSIAEKAFYQCKKVKSVQIRDGVTTIGYAAFYGCEKLSSITMSHSITTISDEAFYFCNALSSVSFSSNTKIIGKKAFCDCIALESLEIPNNVTNIGVQAFSSCSLLKKVILPNSIQEIENGTFSWCSSLEEISIPSNVCSIGGSAFGGCSKLKYIVIPDNIEMLPVNTFSGCKELRTIVLGRSIGDLGPSTFNNCPNVKEIYVTNPQPSKPSRWIDSQQFDENCYNNATFYVPQGSRSNYNFSYWRHFVNVQEYDTSTISDIINKLTGSDGNINPDEINTVSKDKEEVNHYSLDGRKLSTPSKGINIIKMNNGTVKKVLVK